MKQGNDNKIDLNLPRPIVAGESHLKEEEKCPYCGEAIRREARYCSFCGRSFLYSKQWLKFKNDVKEQFDFIENVVIPGLVKLPYGAKCDKNVLTQIENIMITSKDHIYSTAITAFIATVYANNNTHVFDSEGFAKIKYLQDKWTPIIETHKVDEQLFEEFRNDIKEFSDANPSYCKNGKTVDCFFEETIWKLFCQFADESRALCVKMQNIMSTNDGKMDFLIQSGYCTISPFEFEKMIEMLFIKMGYETELTQKTCDYGIDVIARSDRDTIAIQAKKYSKGNNVGNRDVQRLLGAMQLNTVKANKAILITASDFTVQAKEQAKETPIELWDGDYISHLFKKYNV
jgi:hypothetical protein